MQQRSTAQRLNAIEKKQRRRARGKAKHAQDILGVITTSASQPIEPVYNSASSELERMLEQGRADMRLRVRLTEQGKADPGAAKARRELNNWTLGKPANSVADAWYPKGHKTAVGKCDQKRVETYNRLKRAGR